MKERIRIWLKGILFVLGFLLVGSYILEEEIVKQQIAQEEKVRSIHSTDGQGDTLLHKAVCDGDIDKVKKLLTYGMDVNAKNKNGSTPLHMAINAGRAEIAEILLYNGADGRARNSHGFTPEDAAEYFLTQGIR